MRIEDIYNYREPIMEAPYGAFQNVKDTVSSKFGSDEAKGNKEAGGQANATYKEFKGYVGKVAGRGQKFIEAEHLIDFLKSKGMNADIGKQPQDKITPQQAEQLIMKATRSGMRVKPAEPKAQQKTQQAAPQQAPDNELSQQIRKLSAEERTALQKLLA